MSILFGNDKTIGGIIAEALNNNTRQLGRWAHRKTVDGKDCWVIKNPNFASSPPDWLIAACQSISRGAPRCNYQELEEAIRTALQESYASWMRLQQSQEFVTIDGGHTFATDSWNPPLVPMTI